MEWYRQVQFIAAVPMPARDAEELGTTVNGMWAGLEALQDRAVAAEAHARGRRVLFSVPLIALVPDVYKGGAGRHLLSEVCRDIEGNKAAVPWYYWEPEPVYAVCIYSPGFRRYLLDRCQEGIRRGADAVNLDEINTSVGLMSRDTGAPGFCQYCLARFRRNLARKSPGPKRAASGQAAALIEADDEALRSLIADNERLYQRYRRFHEREAFRVVLGFIAELRAYSSSVNPHFAITANVAYLGNEVVTHGGLWGPRWGEHLDFVMAENIYRIAPDGPHELLPRGKFTAWYRLGSAFSSHAPAWICPSILVPKQLAGARRSEYYLLMFLEAYANGGRWAYNWWPGVDAQARMEATVPPQLKDYVSFIGRYRKYYEQAESVNDLAILYLDNCIRQRPESHRKYLALTQVLAEAGYQFDVLYCDNGRLDLERLERYKALLLPEAENLSNQQAQTLTAYAQFADRHVVTFSRNLPCGRMERASGEDLFHFWSNYQDAGRQRILASLAPFLPARLRSSDPMVNVIRYVSSQEQVLHLLNYSYDPRTDRVNPSRQLRICLPWESGAEAICTLLRPSGQEKLKSRPKGGELVIEVPKLDMYGLVTVAKTTMATTHQLRRAAATARLRGAGHDRAPRR